MDDQHTLAHILSVLRIIDAKLDEPVAAYHIGGNAMCALGLKDTTKDVDIIFLRSHEAKAYTYALLACGFLRNEIISLEPGYRLLDAFGIFTHVMQTPLDHSYTPDIRLDVFCQYVCGTLRFSEGMVSRSVPGYGRGHRICAAEDIFLFKSVTSRDRDLFDMARIYEKGLRWDAVETELRLQIGGMGVERGKECLSFIMGRWNLLNERFGYQVPIKKR